MTQHRPKADAPSSTAAKDTHDASTLIAEMPSSVLESLKSGSVPHEAVLAERGRISGAARTRDDERGREARDVVDLVELSLVEHEPETMQLDTMLLDAMQAEAQNVETVVFEDTIVFDARRTSLPPLELEPPRKIELIVEHGGARGGLGDVEMVLAQLPRPLQIGAAVFASATTASVMFALVWTLVRAF